MTKIKSDPRVHTRAVPDPAPIEEMPVAKKLHRKLLLTASRQGLSGARRDAYVYGTMKRIEGNAGKAASEPKGRPERSGA